MSVLLNPARPADRRGHMAVAVALLAVLVLAAGLRFYRLAGQSLWNDEGTSVALAARSLPEITLGAANDIHPPLYYYLLHYWLLLFGTGDAAARSLSAVLGVGVVGLTYLLGRRLFGARAGLVAAVLTAISSYQVYYAQEARMYMLLTLLGIASGYLFYRAWLEGDMEPPASRRWWLVAGWVAVTALATYAHYLAVSLVLAQNAAWLVGLAMAGRQATPRGRLLRPALSWFGAQALVSLLYVPWLRLTWGQLNRWPAVSQPFGLAALVRRSLALFTLGPLVEARPYQWLAAAMLGLVLVGLAWPGRAPHRGWSGRLLILFHWLMPVATLYYLSLSRPVFHPKFLLMATPGFALLAARGVDGLAPAAGGLAGRLGWPRLLGACGAGAILIATSLPGLRNYYFDPRYARDNYRGIAEYIAAAGQPGDVVLINAPGQIETVARYYQGPLPLVPLPRSRPPSRSKTVRELEQLTAQARRVYGIFWATNESDPERIVEGWLDSHAYKALDAWYGSVRLVVYAVPSAEVGKTVEHPLSIDLGGQVRLEGYALAPDEVTAGDILQLSLFWQATNVIPRRYKVFTHVIDDAGRIVGQRDAEPCGGTSFTDTWQEGQRVVDRYGLLILPGTPPGEYLLEVGMYNPGDGLRLPVVEKGEAVADHVILQRLRVARPEAPPPVAALDMQQRRAIKGDGVELLGFSFGRAGALDQGPAPLRPGDTGELVLFWQAGERPRHDLQVVVRVVDQSGRVRLEQRSLPVAGRYPAQNWKPGEIVRDAWHLLLPGNLAPPSNRLLAGWPSTDGRLKLPLHELVTFVVQ